MRTPRPDESIYRVYTPGAIGAAVRHYRLLVELARCTGLDRTHLSALEQGKETAQLRRLFRLPKELGVRTHLERATG